MFNYVESFIFYFHLKKKRKAVLDYLKGPQDIPKELLKSKN